MAFGFGMGFPRDTSAAGGPSLNLQFAGSTTLDPSITFTRASSGSYYDSTGILRSATTNVPRLDYNPSTLQPLGLLIEEARTNLLTYSSEFDNVAWTKVGASVSSNVLTAPDGTLTGDKLVTSSLLEVQAVGQLLTYTAATHTFTVYAKAAEKQFIQMLWQSGATTNYANFDVLNGAVTAGTYVAASITSVGNGWYRCSITATLAATSSLGYVYIIDSGAAARAATSQGNGTSSIYIWGAQLEAGAFATSYIPTTTAAATRAQDSAAINTLTPWFNATEGTLFAAGQLVGGATSTFPYMTALVGTVANTDSIGLQWTASSGALRFGVRSGAVVQADIPNGANKFSGSSFKMAGAYAANYFQAATDGVISAVDTSGSVPTVVALSFGGAVGFQPVANTYINRISYYPRRLSNTELQAITT